MTHPVEGDEPWPVEDKPKTVPTNDTDDDEETSEEVSNTVEWDMTKKDKDDGGLSPSCSSK